MTRFTKSMRGWAIGFAGIAVVVLLGSCGSTGTATVGNQDVSVGVEINKINGASNTAFDGQTAAVAGLVNPNLATVWGAAFKGTPANIGRAGKGTSTLGGGGVPAGTVTIACNFITLNYRAQIVVGNILSGNPTPPKSVNPTYLPGWAPPTGNPTVLGGVAGTWNSVANGDSSSSMLTQVVSLNASVGASVPRVAILAHALANFTVTFTPGGIFTGNAVTVPDAQEAY